MGQSPSSCLDSSRVVVDRPQSAPSSFGNAKSTIIGEHDAGPNQKDTDQIQGKEATPPNVVNASPARSFVPTVLANNDGPPSPTLPMNQPPASVVPHDGGILNFLLTSSESDESIPTQASDMSNLTNEEKARPPSPTWRAFAPRARYKWDRSGAKSLLTSPMPAKTKLFYRDPLDLERYGLDVSDETTVAGTQIYAARVVAKHDRETMECSGESTETSASSNDNISGKNPPAMCDGAEVPHISEAQDETSVLLLPTSANFNPPSALLSKGKTQRRFHRFGRSKQRPKNEDALFCSCTLNGNCNMVHSRVLCRNYCDSVSYSERQMLPRKFGTSPHIVRHRETSIPAYPKGCASFLFSREAVRNNTAAPVTDIVCVNKEQSIYIADIGLSAMDCRTIIGVAEHCSRGTWAAYTYAKQTLGCREYDALASVCVGPVMTATATIMEELEEPFVDNKDVDKKDETGGGHDDTTCSIAAVSETRPPEERRPDSAPQIRPRYKRQLVLDDREPHLVKYDISKQERRKLQIHTDKSEWTVLISLSEGCGADYRGGGTYFECIDSTVHVSRGHALIFPGKLRHRGQAIANGCRFLLVGFFVDEEAKEVAASPTRRKVTSSTS